MTFKGPKKYNIWWKYFDSNSNWTDLRVWGTAWNRNKRELKHENGSLPNISIKGPQPLGHGPVPVHGLLGTGPHSRMWAAGERVKLHLPLPIALHLSHYRLHHCPSMHPPHLWKNCLPWNRSLMPKSLGTTDLYERHLWNLRSIPIKVRMKARITLPRITLSEAT